MATASIIRKVHTETRHFTGRRKHSRQPKQERTAGHSGNGFLNHEFKPFAGYYVRDWQQAEKEFFVSLSNLCRFYSCEVPDVSGFSFPLNIQTAYRKVVLQLKLNDSLSLRIMQDDEHDACLATTETFDTGYRLYYIPVKPVCRLCSRDDHQLLSKLMIPVYQYLYQIVGIDYYRDPCYLHSMYETIENWMDEGNDGEDEDYRQYQKDELQELKTSGDRFLRSLNEPFSLEMLDLVLVEFRNSGEWTLAADLLVQEIRKLAMDYPGRSIRQSIPDDYYDTGANDLVGVEHYLSFYWSENDGLSETLFEMINNELQEMCYQEEPVAVQFFDSLPEKEHHNFDFENRLFALLNELIDFINQFDHEGHQQ